MLVRFYDKESDRCRKSEVYAIINTGIYEKMLLHVQSGTEDYLKLFDAVERNGSGFISRISRVLYTIPEEWISRKTAGVDEIFPEYISLKKESVRFYHFFGFSWLWEDQAILTRLLKGEKIPAAGSAFEGKLYSDRNEPGWNYVETQQDIDYFMDKTGGLHDSVIHSILYESGDYVDEEKAMHLPELRHVVMEIHSQWCPRMELIFDGVTALNVRPPGDNSFGDIFDCTLAVKNCEIYFADCELQQADISYQGTWITAYSLKWRFL